MKLILERWRKFQLNEIFNSPLPDDEIDLVPGDSEFSHEWVFYVDDKRYNMHIGIFPLQKYPDLLEWEVEFSQGGGYEQTNYGIKTAVVVMSTVLKILMDWVPQNRDNFFLITSTSYDRIRTRLYNRLLEDITKKLGSDYTSATLGGIQCLINIGLIERKVNKFIEESNFESARKIVADALNMLNKDGIKKGEIIQRILELFDKVEEAQFGPAETKTDLLKRRRAAYNAGRGKEQ